MEPIAPYHTRNGNGKYRKPEQPPALPAMFNKLPPQAVELEQVVLGALMLDREALPIVADILHPESFYRAAHADIYAACLLLYGRGEPIDILTVTEELRRTGNLDSAGGSHYLAELTNRVASAANIEYHARIIAQKALQREMIRLGQKMVNEGYSEEQDVFETLHICQREIFALGEMKSRGATPLRRIISDVLIDIEAAAKIENGITGIPSGFADLDKVTGGWQNTDLIIIAARPSMGKTALCLQMALNAAKLHGKRVAIFSLEMGKNQLGVRMLSSDSEIHGLRLRNGKLYEYEWQELQATVEKLEVLPIHIDDTPGINIFDLRSNCRRMKLKYGVDMVIIDYLQLMSGINSERGGNREQEISSIARGLKNLAKELNVPVIAISQLNRAVETRGGSKRPQLSDLRESGAIEQEADIVSFIYRPEYYGIFEDGNGRSMKGIAEFIVAKHRNGALDTVELRFTDSTTRFSDINDVPVLRPGMADVIDYTIPASARPDLNDEPCVPF